MAVQLEHFDFISALKLALHVSKMYLCNFCITLKQNIQFLTISYFKKLISDSFHYLFFPKITKANQM